MTARTFRIPRLALLLGVSVSGTAIAGSFQLGEEISGEYKLTMNYAVGMRMQDPADELIDGPVDLLQPAVLPPGQIIGFIHTGLPTTINFDDGNRNFKKHSLINNRVTAFGEMQFTYENYGAAFSGSAFYDQVYHDENDNDSPETVNKLGAHDEFTRDTEHYDGERARILDAYAWGEWGLFDDRMFLNVRVGRHLAAWGESLFFAGVAQVQGPQDATKAFVPGAEVKDILLPVNQVSVRLAVTPELTLLGQYRLEYKPTEIFPHGNYFSPADAVGPGADFVYGSINPAALDGCPGLLGPLSPLCNLGGIGTPLLNAPPNIIVPRNADILPSDDGQWGIGFNYQMLPTLNVGLYELRYHSTTPAVVLNPGFAFIGSVAGIPLTTGLLNQYVPVSYNVKYFDDIKMHAASFSTVLGAFNVAGEVSLREDIDMQAQAIISGVLSPVYTRGDIGQALVSALYATNPKFLFYDDLALVGEAGYIRVYDVQPLADEPGIDMVGDGDVLFADKSSWAFQLLALPKGRNVFPGWDITTPVSYGGIVRGNPAMAGAFAAYYGEGDHRLSVGANLQYLQNLEFGIGYNWFFGDPSRTIGNSTLAQNPYEDRDYVTFNVKYNL